MTPPLPFAPLRGMLGAAGFREGGQDAGARCGAWRRIGARAMKRCRRLVPPALLGFGAPRRVRALKGHPTLTADQVLEREIERAFQCGARYSCNGWRRCEPPRMRGVLPGSAIFPLTLALTQAFHRGYEAATRARYAHAREWAA